MELLVFGKNGWGDELFFATLMTLAVAITAMLIGFLFALIFTPLKISKNKILNFIGNFYTTVIRCFPELFVIFLFFFGGSTAVMFVAKIFGYEGFPEDQKKTYSNLIKERNRLEGTREQKDLGQQPIKQSKKRKNNGYFCIR